MLSPCILQSRVDALTLAFRGQLADFELARLARAAPAGQPGSVELAGEPFEVTAHGGPTLSFLLRNANSTVRVGPDAHGFHVSVDLRALFLRRTPIERAVAYAEKLARHFIASHFSEIRVRRADLCVDATGVSFCREDEERCVTRARGKIRFHTPDKVFTRKRRAEVSLTGFVISPKNPLMVRIYDKTEELLAVHGLDSEKTRTELATFRSNGWDGASPVWRVEAQLRTSVLQQLGASSPSELARSLDSIWHYVVGRVGDGERAWLRFVDSDSGSRLERCRTDSRWQLYQSAKFVGASPVERVHGSQGGVTPEQALGAIFSLLGATSALDEDDGTMPIGDLVRRDLARAAEIFVSRQQLVRTYRRKRAAARSRHWTNDVVRGAS